MVDILRGSREGRRLARFGDWLGGNIVGSSRDVGIGRRRRAEVVDGEDDAGGDEAAGWDAD